MLTILLDGLAYGMLLFVLASGLSVTLGLMNFINLAHGAFAMIGGYVTALLMNRAGVPFLATLPAAFVIPAILGVVLERTLYRRLYGASPLRSGPIHDRPCADGDADRRLSHRRRAATGSFADLA